MTSESEIKDTDAKGVVSRRSRRAWITLLIVIIAALGIDLITKHLAFQHIAGEPVNLTRAQILEHTHVRPEGGVYLDMSRLIPSHKSVRAIPGLLDLTLVLNPGAVFGIGAGKRWAFVAFTAVAIGFGLWIFGTKTYARQWQAQVAIGLLIGGGLGNLYDRLVYACVRDFLHPLPRVQIPFGLAWPDGSTGIWPYVSNIADLFLLIGIGMLMWHIWRTDPPKKKGDAAKPKTSMGRAKSA